MIGIAFSTFLTWIVRTSTGHSTFEHFLDWEAILTVSLLAAPLGFLVGFGGFDYWFYWAAGRKTRPEDHSGHGAYTWKDYFRINTDHKVIGIQYTVNSFIFLLIGGLIAMLMRAQAQRVRHDLGWCVELRQRSENVRERGADPGTHADERRGVHRHS